MWLGVDVFDQNYIPIKAVVSGIVLVWNYTDRKFLVFQ